MLPIYILVDCDTCPDSLTLAVWMFEEMDNVLIHGYSISLAFPVPQPMNVELTCEINTDLDDPEYIVLESKNSLHR